MKKREEDIRQRKLGKLLHTISDPGEARLEMVMQSTIYAGLSAALRFEEKASLENKRMPAICVVDTCKRGIYAAIQSAAHRIGVPDRLIFGGYEKMLSSLIVALSKTNDEEHRPVCVCFDHAGAVHPEKIETAFRIADDLAYRQDLSVRLVWAINRVEKHSAKKGSVWKFPTESRMLYPRWRAYEYGDHGFVMMKDAEQFRALGSERDERAAEPEQEQRTFKIA